MGRLYVNVSSQLGNRHLNSIREGIKQTMEEIKEEATEDLYDKILMNIEDTKSDNDNSLLNEYSLANYINIEDYLEIIGDEVGFFVDGEVADIIINNEFGGTIFVSDAMRDWGRMIAAQENKGKSSFAERTPPPFSNTDQIIIPERAFLRSAFEDFKRESTLKKITSNIVTDWLDGLSRDYEEDRGANILTFERSGRKQERRQSPKGGMYFNGKYYKGGQFLPNL